MGGKWSPEAKVVSRMQGRRTSRGGRMDGGLVIPNHSGQHNAGSVTKTPVNDNDIANKKYVDDNAGGAPEGTAVKSTGEAGGTKYLREDGDGTCSWQTPAGSGDVTAAANMTDNTIVKGDGGAKGVQDTGVSISDTEQISGAISLSMDGATSGSTVLQPDAVASGTLTLPAATDTLVGRTTTDTLTNKTLTSPTLTAPVLGTPSSGTLTSCTGLPVAGTLLAAGTNCTLSTNTLNVDDSFIINDGDDTSTGKITAANFAVTADNNTNDTTYVPMVLHGTDATPPTASTVPRGTVYIQYTP